MTTINNTSQRGRRVAWIALLVIVLTAVSMVAIPVWLIQPFRPQSERGVALSYVLHRWAPVVTLFGLLASLTLVVWLWRGARRWWRKALLLIILLPLLPATWFARQNHFEWMFNPLPNAAYAKTTEAAFLTDADVLLAVNINGEGAAYPIRYMAYHHLVQDVVGGTPLVATY